MQHFVKMPIDLGLRRFERAVMLALALAGGCAGQADTADAGVDGALDVGADNDADTDAGADGALVDASMDGPDSGLEDSGPAWEPVPMRTAADKAAGHLGGEMGQNAYSLAICARDPRYLALGIDTAGAYVSEDGGRNWSVRRSGIPSNGVQSIAFDPADCNVLWAATSRHRAGTVRTRPPDPLYYDDAADGIYRSGDLGRTWARVRPAVILAGVAQNEYFAFDTDSATAGEGSQVLFAITHDAGLLKTDDGGDTWSEIGPADVTGNAVVRNGSWIWFATDQGLWVSTNGGDVFTESTVGDGMSTVTQPIRGLVVHPSDPQLAYVAAGAEGIWSTNDGGASWRRHPGRQIEPPRAAGLLPDENWARLAMSPANPELLYADANAAGGPYPYYSDSGGAEWHAPTDVEPGFNGGQHFFSMGIVAHPTDPSVAYSLSPVRITNDGGRTWSFHGNGVSGFRRSGPTTIAFQPDDRRKMMFFHTDHGSAWTEDDGDTWTYAPAPRQGDIGAMTQHGGAYDPTPGSRAVISAVGGWTRQRLCRSEDDGETWEILLDAGGMPYEGNFIFFAWHGQDDNVVYVGGGSTSLRSDDGGRTWSTVERPIRGMLARDGDIVYSLSEVSERNWIVERSDDQGESWAPLGDPLLGTVRTIAVDPEDPDRVYAATHSGVRSYDGASWTSHGAESGLENDFFGRALFTTVAVDPRDGNIVYAGQNHSFRGASGGVFRSTDGGVSWENINLNLGPELTVWSISVSPHDGTVWLGSDYGNLRLRL